MKLYSILWPFVFLLELVNCYMWDEDYCFFQFLSIRDRENGWLNYNTGFVNLDQSTTLCVLLICLEMDDLYWFSRMGVASCTGGSTYANFSQLKSLVCNFELTTGLLQVWDAWTPGSERPGFTGPTTLGIQEVDIQLTDDAGCKSVGNWLAWQEKYCYFPPILTTYSGPHLAGLQRCICETGGVDYANYWYSRILYERCAGTTLYANLYDMMTKVCVPG